MNRKVFEEMLQKLGCQQVTVVLDAIARCSTYSSGQQCFSVNVSDIHCYDGYVLFEYTDINFGVCTTRFVSICVPYERIVAVGKLS